MRPGPSTAASAALADTRESSTSSTGASSTFTRCSIPPLPPRSIPTDQRGPPRRPRYWPPGVPTGTDLAAVNILGRRRVGRVRAPSTEGRAVSVLRVKRLEHRERRGAPSAPPTGVAQRARRTEPEPRQKPAPWHDDLQKWVALVASVVALVLSVYNFITQQQPPDVAMTFPSQVRIAQGEEVWLYVRPSSTATAESARNPVITQLELKVKALAGPAAGQEWNLVWDELGDWTYDPKDQRLTWRYLEDPSPFVVDASSTVAPTILWKSEKPIFRQGTYELTLVATGSGVKESGTGCIELKQEDANQLREQGQMKFSQFPTKECKARDA